MMTLFNYLNLNPDKMKDSILNSNMDTTLKSAIVLILNDYMEKERDDYLNAAAYERTSSRQDYRNGYYERELLISIGKIKLRVPRTREGDFSPSLFEKFSRIDQTFVLSMLEMVVNGVSTRKVSDVVETLCGERVSKSFVSSLTEKLDPIINRWANRPLNTEHYPYVFMDAMYIKVREHRKVVSKAVYIATAIKEDGRRAVLGLKVDTAESYDAWQSFIKHLKSRGLHSPKLVISDAHEGLKKAIQREFVGTSWQRCSVHLKRNIINKLPKKGYPAFISDLRQIFNSPDAKSAQATKDWVMDKYNDVPKLQKALETLENGFDDAIQFLNEDSSTFRYIKSTNHLERVNQEVRRRERVIRIFPNTQSAFRIIAAVLMQIEEKEMTRKRRLF